MGLSGLGPVADRNPTFPSCGEPEADPGSKSPSSSAAIPLSGRQAGRGKDAGDGGTIAAIVAG